MTLDILLGFFLSGMSPEKIHASCPGVGLGAIYATIASYYENKAQFDEYLRRREGEAKALEEFFEARDPGRAGMRQRLLERHKQRKQA